SLGTPAAAVQTSNGYRVVSRALVDQFGRVIAFLQYAKPVSHVNHTMARVKLFLLFGVVAGTALALLAGLALARRAMTPIANLKLLAAELEGEEGEIAASALRSSRRMRRLVADLLLLARADAGRVARREPLDVAAVVREAVGEAASLSDDHVLSVEVDDGGR